MDRENRFFTLVFMVLFAVMILFALTRCSVNIPIPSFNSNTTYRYDMTGTVNGVPFNGVGVAPKADKYEFEFQSKIDIDAITISTCHRDYTDEAAHKGPWLRSRRIYKYEFIPARGIEDKGSCLMRVGAYDKGPPRMALAVIDFETPEETLPADNLCNGKDYQTNGVSICQSQAGLMQVIRFPVPVQVANGGKCQFTPSSDKTAWSYLSPDGECVAAFMELGGEHRLHRHTAIGYKDVPLRGE